MRFSVVLAIVAALLSGSALAQKHQKPKAKPSYNEEKEAKSSGRAVRPSSNRSSSAQELHRLEQSSAKAPGVRRTPSNKTARAGTALKTQNQERNPPIAFSSSGGGGQGGGKGKGANSTKGRLRHKGSHR